MKDQFIVVDGQTIAFQLVPANVGYMCHVAGVVPFGVSDAWEARDSIRNLFSKKHLNDERVLDDQPYDY